MSVRPITEDDLHAFIDGALDDAREAEVSTYLESHPDIAARIESYRRQRLNLRAALDPIIDKPVPTHLTLSHVMEARRQRRPFIWALAAAATVLLFVGGSGGWILHGFYQSPREGIVALGQEATANYGVYASNQPRPVELRADKSAELVDWATKSMKHKPVLPDLSKAGYRLMGGRIVATAHGAGLMLMYDDDHGTRLVLLTRPMAVDQNKPMAAHAMGNVGGWSWATAGMGYSLVSALPADKLHTLADDIRRQTEVGA